MFQGSVVALFCQKWECFLPNDSIYKEQLKKKSHDIDIADMFVLCTNLVLVSITITLTVSQHGFNLG